MSLQGGQWISHNVFHLTEVIKEDMCLLSHPILEFYIKKKNTSVYIIILILTVPLR